MSAKRVVVKGRVPVDPDEVVVIDFKSCDEADPDQRSEFEDENRARLARYVALMKEFYPKCTVRGVLAYLDQLRFEEVE